MSEIVLSSYHLLKEKIERLNDKIHVVIGPRQVGKTTTVKQICRDLELNSKYLTADGEISRLSSWLLVEWQKAVDSKVDLLVVDEIQKIENWSETVKLLWERRVTGEPKLVVLGSSSLELHRGLSESLAGRFYLYKFRHWSYEESSRLVPNLSKDEYLRYGGYPGSYALLGNKSEWLNYIKTSIVNTVIGQDILNFAQIKSPALFKQCFDLLCGYAGREISYTKLLGQLQDKGNTDLVKYYIELFESAFLIKSLQKYSSKLVKLKSSSPKIIPLAPALFSSAIDLDFRDEDYGHSFEIAVCNELLKLPGEIFYWRERNYEVDFIYKEGRSVHAIEVKYKKVRSTKGTEKFLEKFPDAKAHIVTIENYMEIIPTLSKLI